MIAEIITFRKSDKNSLEGRAALISQAGKKHSVLLNLLFLS